MRATTDEGKNRLSQLLSLNSGWLADVVLGVHFSLAGFVVVGEIMIVLGALLGARWVRNFLFRAIHLGCMIFIAAETALGLTCPLTSLEHMLRVNAGETAYSASFIEHWLRPLLFFDAPPWVFVLLHMMAALAIVLTWFIVRPKWPQRADGPARGADVALL